LFSAVEALAMLGSHLVYFMRENLDLIVFEGDYTLTAIIGRACCSVPLKYWQLAMAKVS